MLRNRIGGRLLRADASVRLLPVIFVILVIVGGCSDSLAPESAPRPSPTPESASRPSPAPESASRPSLAPESAPRPERPSVVVGEVAFQVELAVTPAERQQGLSGRERLAPREGMLFVYGEPRVLSFWMREMLFPLDFVWIGPECTVVDITREVPIPPPGAALGALPTYSPSSPASYNLEIGAGEAARAGLAAGAPVRFVGIVAEGADC